MTFETVLASRSDGVARIVLNRPEVRNALSRTLLDELAPALAQCEADPGHPGHRVVRSGRPSLLRRGLTGLGDCGTTLQARESFTGLARILEALPQVGLSDAAKEGIAAFFEKRPPRWKRR